MTLKDSILKAAEFDAGWARRDLKQALIEADPDKELSAEQVHHLLIINIKSAEWENARLRPLLLALADACEALEKSDMALKNVERIGETNIKLRGFHPFGTEALQKVRELVNG
jgi:hypothetical protein